MGDPKRTHASNNYPGRNLMRECDEKEKANRIENRNNIIQTNMINCSKHATKYQGITQEREIEKFSRLIGS